MKRVSIIVPIYNRYELISYTLESILKQGFVNWECILVDDYSTDQTVNILNDYAQKDIRFKVIANQSKKGSQGSRNTGLQQATGDLIVFFDSDNIMYPNHLEKKNRCVL